MCALAESRFCHLGKRLIEPSMYNEIPLCKILYFARGMGLLAEKGRRGYTVDQKIVTMQGSIRSPTPLMVHSYTL